MYRLPFHNCQDLEATKMSFNKQMGEQTDLYLYKGMLFNDNLSNRVAERSEPSV